MSCTVNDELSLVMEPVVDASIGRVYATSPGFEEDASELLGEYLFGGEYPL